MAYDTEVQTLSPVHYWRLNGNATDAAGTLDGAASGITWSTTVPHAGNTNSAQFERGTDTITIGTSTDIDNQTVTAQTWSVLLQPTLDTLPFTLVEYGNTTSGMAMFLAAGMVPAISITNASTTVTTFASRPLRLDEFAQVAFRYDAGTVDIFIDGLPVATNTVAASVAATTTGTTVGDGFSLPIPGGTLTVYNLSARMTDLAMWNSVVSDANIYDVLFAESAASTTAQAQFTGIPDGTEIRLFDPLDSLNEIGTGLEYSNSQPTYSIDYAVTTTRQARLVLANVESRYEIVSTTVTLPRLGTSFPVDLLLVGDLIYENDWLQPFAPDNLTPPVIDGTGEVGQTLTVTSDGTWFGRPTPTFTYQWLRDGSPIPGETSSAYLLVSADEDKLIRCEVTATNAIGADTAQSNAISLLTSGVIGYWRHTGGATPTTTPTVLNFDTEDRNDASFYSKNGSAVVLPAGRYLAIYQLAWIGSGGNGRSNPVIEARKNGTLIPGSRGSGYQRDTANDAAWALGQCIVESDGNDEIDFRIFRDSDSSVGAADSTRTNLMIVSINAGTHIGEYVATGTNAYGAQSYAQVALGTTTQETSPSRISRTGSTITLGTNGTFLVVAGCYFDGTTARTTRFTHLTLDGSHVPGSTGYAMMRTGTDEFGAPNSFAIVETGGSTSTLTLEARGPGPGGTTVDGGATLVAADSGITVVELAAAEWFACSDATGGQDANTDIVLTVNQSTDHANTSVFSSTTTSSFTAAADLDLLVSGAVVVRRTSSNGTRLTREARLLVDSTPVVWHGSYNRGDQSSQDAYDNALHPRGLVSMTASQVLTWSIDNDADAGWQSAGGSPTTLGWAEPAGLYALDMSTL